MIENKVLQSFLVFTGKVFDKPSMQPLREFIRIFYLQSAPYLVERLLAIPSIKLSLRHSVTNSAHFNPCFSDLDFDIIVPTDCENAIAQVRNRFALLKTRFPCIGEAEIYSEREYHQLREIRSRRETAITFLHNLRKLSWTTGALNQAPSNYHRYKAARAVKIVLTKLGCSSEKELSAKVEQFLKTEFPQVFSHSIGVYEGPPVLNGFLGMKLATDSHTEDGNSELVLTLSPTTFFLIIAIIPGSSELSDELQQQIKCLRGQYEVLEQIHRDYVCYEKLMFNGFRRFSINPPSWADSWLSILDRDLSYQV